MLCIAQPMALLVGQKESEPDIGEIEKKVHETHTIAQW